MKYRVLLPLVAVALCHAQDAPDTSLFTRAPKEVDDALRARITEFFQDHVDGRFRQAAALVADDTQDFYFEANKPHYLGFEIGAIEYSDSFTKARAKMIVSQIILQPGFTDHPASIPIASTWKLENGKWCWYVDAEALRNTPFGRPQANGGSKAPADSGRPVLPDFNAVLAGVGAKVTADKTEVVLAEGTPARVVITNGEAGSVTLAIDQAIPGVAAEFDRTGLAKDQQAVLTLRKTGSGTQSGAILVRVNPLNKVIPVQVSIP